MPKKRGEKMTLEKRVKELEKRVAALEARIPEQPTKEEIAKKIKEILKEEISAVATIPY
jgi:uncharacterized coiled-coil protein SlyX